MIAAHGNSLRSIIMYLDALTSQEVCLCSLFKRFWWFCLFLLWWMRRLVQVISLELSTGIPLLYIFKEGKFMRRGSPVGPTEAGVYAYTRVCCSAFLCLVSVTFFMKWKSSHSFCVVVPLFKCLIIICLVALLMNMISAAEISCLQTEVGRNASLKDVLFFRQSIPRWAPFLTVSVHAYHFQFFVLVPVLTISSPECFYAPAITVHTTGWSRRYVESGLKRIGYNDNNWDWAVGFSSWFLILFRLHKFICPVVLMMVCNGTENINIVMVEF